MRKLHGSAGKGSNEGVTCYKNVGIRFEPPEINNGGKSDYGKLIPQNLK